MTSAEVATVAPAPGDLVELEVGPVAHGGHCVARLDGRVVFVRHALPDERVLVRLEDAGAAHKFWRGDVVDVLEASPDRVPSAWPEAGAAGVGGGELAHVALPAQRAWKAAVVREQLQRLAHVEPDVVVEAAPGDDERGGLRWRTRISLVADVDGSAGMHVHRSHDVVALDEMPLGSEDLEPLDLFRQAWPAGSRVEAVAPVGGDRPLVVVDGVPWSGGRPDTRPNARSSVREVVRASVDGLADEYRYRVSGLGFWQVHREAPALLVDAVARAVGDVEGGTVLDLYSGAGLFTSPLADLVGPRGRVVAVEGDARAAHDARRNAHGRESVELLTGEVGAVLASGGVPRADVVVLDPPRVGAGRAVVERVATFSPGTVVYVACDPAALARDVATFASLGWSLTGLQALDLFPMTHHVECVAVLRRD